MEQIIIYTNIKFNHTNETNNKISLLLSTLLLSEIIHDTNNFSITYHLSLNFLTVIHSFHPVSFHRKRKIKKKKKERSYNLHAKRTYFNVHKP